MSVVAVARKDFQDALRSRLLWVLTALFGLLTVGLGAAYGLLDELNGGSASGADLVTFVGSSITLFVTVAAIVVCHRSIAGERESGSIKLLLALPHTRWDVVVGKLLGRSGVLAVAVVGTALVGVLVGAALGGIVPPVATAAFVVMTLLFVVAYAGVFVGVSALTGSTTFATALAVVYFVVFEVLWNLVALLLVFLANGLEFPSSAADVPDWFFLVSQVPPSSAYETALDAVLPSVQASTGGASFLPTAATVDAFYGTPWLGVVVLVLWLAVPLAVGGALFSRADL